MKRLFCLAAAALLLALAAPVLGDFVGQTDQAVKEAADPIMDGILAGFNDGNYGQYSKNFDDTLKESISEKKFRQTRADIQQKLGRYQSRAYLGFLQQNRMTVVLWKGRFEKAESDVLIKLVLSKRGDRVVVTGLWFQ